MKRSRTKLTFEVLEPRLQMAVVINEFLAANTSGLMDADGDRSDWIELRNDGAAPVDLTSWHLTDDELDLDKWQLPSTNLPAGGYLVVFASGKDRAVSGQELHTNFSLEQNGESLLLVMSDGTTIADAFDPFPEQLNNVSYGRGGQVPITENLVGEQAPVKALVPNVNTSATWHTTSFDDSTWLSGIGGVGHDNVPDYTPYFNLNIGPQMLNVRASAYLRYAFQVTNPADVTSLLLRIRYDDGFAVYLNGTLIPAPTGQRNAPASLTYQSAATQGHADNLAVIYEDVDLSAYRHLLVPGNNVLAIHGLNIAANNADFLISPLLAATRLSDPVLGYMATPTPNGANQPGTLGFVADTNFSVDRGFYTNSFTVTIATATPDAEIRYTLDGSAPTATTGVAYNPASPPLITTTTTLRAAAFKAGFTPTNVDTQTYVFLDDVIEQDGVGLPPVAPWGYAGPDWAMDPDVVNHPSFATTIKDDLKSVPTVSLVMPWDDWFGGGGQGIYPIEAEIERAVSMEYFTADGSGEFQIDGGIEIQGGTSDDRWKMDKLSMRVKFTEPYGPEKLDADIFHGGARDEGVATSFNTFILDAHLGYTWAYGGATNPVDQRSRAMFIQDGYVSDLQNLAGGAAPHTQWVHLYINGLYWGMYEMHERADEHFAESYLGGNDEDYDVIKHNQNNVVSSDVANPNSAIVNYAAMLALVRADMNVPANYEAAAAKIDVDDFITYMIVNYYVGNDDWAHQNWYASYNRVDPNGKWRYHSWDAENVLKDVNRNWTGDIDSGRPTEVFHLLMANPEFRLKFVDGVQRLMRNPGGLLTPTEAAAVYQARMQEIDRAIVGESARWGDSHTTVADPPGAGNPYIRDHWVARQNDLLVNYFPARTNIVLGQFTALNWIVPVPAPEFSQYGGTVNEGYSLTLTMPPSTPAGTVILYTLDGTDPRDPATNLPRGSALTYSGPIVINAGTRVMARIYRDLTGSSPINEWSPLVDQSFVLPTPFSVRITEFNYHPAASEDHEFIELMNTGNQSVNLAGVQLTQFQSEPVVLGNVSLAAGQRIILAKNPVAFEALYGAGYNVLPTGYTGNLSNGGEPIELLGPIGESLQSFSYSDSAPWPTAADGAGPTLEIIDPLGDPTDPTNWRASLYVGGSPGASGVPGDYDGNGIVQEADHGIWRSRFGDTVAVGTHGDGNRNGLVDLGDYVVWREAMTSSGTSAGVATAAAGAAVNQPANSSPANEPLIESQQIPEATFNSVQAAAPRSQTLAIDDAFSHFHSPPPASRVVLASTRLAEVADVDLLNAVFDNRAVRGRDKSADRDIDPFFDERQSTDNLFSEWAQVAGSLRLD